jgi:hypothetical protein
MQDLTLATLLPSSSGSSSHELASTAAAPATGAACGYGGAPPDWVTPCSFPLHTCCHPPCRPTQSRRSLSLPCACRYAELRLHVPADAYTVGKVPSHGQHSCFVRSGLYVALHCGGGLLL